MLVFVFTMRCIPRPPLVKCVICKLPIRDYSSKHVPKLPEGKAQSKSSSSNANILKRFHSENKLLFGRLLETSSQRRKTKGVINNINAENEYTLEKSTKEDLSSELWWWKNSKTKVLRFAQVRLSSPEQNEQYKSNVKNSFEQSELCDGLHTSPLDCSTSKSKGFDSPTEYCKSQLKLPTIIVRNLTTFPLENVEKKNICNDPRYSCDILNVTLTRQSSSDESYAKYPSVSKILNATMSDASKAALQKWKEDLIRELGEEGFQKYQKELLNDGKIFHNTLHKFLSGTPVKELTIPYSIEGCWQSMSALLPQISDVRVLESHVVHKDLLYHGIIDCVASYKGKPLLIEWKKSNKQKPTLRNTYDAPLQVAAYLGALNFDSNYDFKVAGGIVVVAYNDGMPANIHQMNWTECNKYWHMWLQRLQLYWKSVNMQDCKRASLVS